MAPPNGDFRDYSHVVQFFFCSRKIVLRSLIHTENYSLFRELSAGFVSLKAALTWGVLCTLTSNDSLFRVLLVVLLLR